ncbi:hypothetical protein [Paenibacillus sp. MMS18-CY102]|uniref:hypothetical protein n=1 Tax=Paenibacillus sp. MMS18-CY102 TaxID=2682849 RepID=UPI0013659006|nr:hypothetical protein [Paenibacillus sp. MMS18-CY102]MWC29195.1 hypothetical protein [Paenibacillus sp. MMS18-CY102]
MISKRSTAQFNKAREFIMDQGRELDQKLFMYHFENGSRESVLDVLRNHQNLDGGFQNTGEGPRNESSPIGTSVAFQHLIALDASPDSSMVRDGINYIITSFNTSLEMWQPASDWLHEGDNLIQGWGNPSAELVGYLYKYRQWVPASFLQKALDLAEKNLSAVTRPMDPFVLLCYMRLADIVPDPLKKVILQKLYEDVPKVIEADESKWPNWCIKPYWFAKSPSSPVSGLIKRDVIRSLDYEIRNLTNEGFIPLHWNASEEDTKAWRSILTLDVLRALRDYNMLEV